MGSVMWEVEFFELPSGNCPVAEYLSTLSKESDLPYIIRIFSLAEEYGYELQRPHSAPLRDKILELRVSTKSGTFRFLYFFDNRKIIITHGFKKKTRKVPNRQIEKAIEYRNIYFERSKR